MQRRTLSTDTQPWYRQGWPWLLISLPASAVIGGIITLVLAIQSPNALVVDDYYKEGLAINEKKHRLTAARDMNLQGLLRSNGNQLTLSLSGTAAVMGNTLTLRLIHSTRAELDRELELRRTNDGSYNCELDDLAAGTWYLRLRPIDNTWEIRARMPLDGPFQALLTAKG